MMFRETSQYGTHDQVQDESEKVEEPQKRSMLWRHKKSVSWLTFWVEEDFLDSWGGG
jgi:hypothetical protein